MLKAKQFSQKWLRPVVLSLLSVAASGASAQQADPWSLRDHYAFGGENANFRVDVKTAEWMVEVTGRGTVVDGAQCEIEFGDGEVLRLSSMSSVKDGRDKFSSPLGEGTYFRSTFRTGKSLEIEYTVARFSDRPFLLLFVSVENHGQEPVELASIRPVVFDAGSVSNFGAGTKVSYLGARRRGIFPVVYENGDASLVRFELPDPNVTLGIGLLQSGMMESRIHLQPEGDTWHGGIDCALDPPLRLEPGDKVASDTVWLSFLVDKPSEVHEYHAWAESKGSPNLNLERVPPSWITVEPNQSSTALFDAARQWGGSEIQYILVPAGWEEKPGSLKGAKPNYPRDMSKIAGTLRGIRLRPGLTVDPLAAAGCSEAWCAEGADGATWLDVTNKGAFDYGIEQMQTVAGWGYEFFVVAPSTIPDAMLDKFNLTRAQADTIALEIVARAAQGIPVFPSASASLGNDVAKWQAAATTMGLYREYGMLAGPVRLSLDADSEVSRDLAAAIAAYSGPVEYIGYPKRKIRKSLVLLRAESD